MFKVCKLSNADENVVLILARCLPHIVPNVLLNKREVRNGKSRLYCTTASRKRTLPSMIISKDILVNGGLKLEGFRHSALSLTSLRFSETAFVVTTVYLGAFRHFEKQRKIARLSEKKKRATTAEFALFNSRNPQLSDSFSFASVSVYLTMI